MPTERDIRRHKSIGLDLRNLANEKGIILCQTPELLRVVFWGQSPRRLPDGKRPFGFVVADHLPVRGGMSDFDIVVGGVRYGTRGGVRMKGFHLDQGPERRSNVLGCVYRRYLKDDIKGREVKRMLKNRITEYLSDKPE